MTDMNTEAGVGQTQQSKPCLVLIVGKRLSSSGTTVEDYRPGYPQFSALIGSHSTFHICRRFLRIRARLLLLKQDELSLLEGQLDQVDREEERELFLRNARRDNNPERKTILMKIEVALSNYGEVILPLPISVG